MSDVKTEEADLWLMDGGLPNDPSLLEGIVVPQEVEEAIEAYFAKALNEDEVQPAA